jgi:hypothetical protein
MCLFNQNEKLNIQIFSINLRSKHKAVLHLNHGINTLNAAVLDFSRIIYRLDGEYYSNICLYSSISKRNLNYKMESIKNNWNNLKIPVQLLWFGIGVVDELYSQCCMLNCMDYRIPTALHDPLK